MESVNDFSNEIKKNNNIFIIKLGAEWCGPCKAIEPLVDKYFKMLIEKKINCQQIDVDEALDIFAFLKRKRVITGIPAILLYKKNNDSHMPDDSVLSGNKDDVIQFFERTLQLIQN